MKAKHSLIIRWSDEDQCYIAWVPEYGTGVKTHGTTYEEAARMGEEIIELMIESDGQEHRPSPQPWLFADPQDDERVGKFLFPDNQAYQPPAKAVTKNVKHATA